MKRIYAYVLAAVLCSIIMVLPVLAQERIDTEIQSEGLHFDSNFRYIVPMDNKSVEIDFEAGLIIALRSDVNFESGTTDESYALFDLDGNIVVDYGVYDRIEFARGSGYVKVDKGEDEYLINRTGKEADLPAGEKIFENYNTAESYIIYEGEDYFRIIDRGTNEEIRVSKNDLLDSGDDCVSEISRITDDFIVFGTKLGTVVYSKDMALRYRFDKARYISSAESEYNFDNPSMMLDFNEKGCAGFRDEKRLCGVIDTYGNIIIEPEYKYLLMAGDYIEVCKNGKWGVINYINEIIIEIKYDEVVPYLGNDTFLLKENGKNLIMNIKEPDMFKNTVFEPVGFIDYDSGLLQVKKGEKFGVMTFDGKIVALPVYDYIQYREAEDMICVGNQKDDGSGMRYGYIDKDGLAKIPVIYRDIYDYSEGLFGVHLAEYGEDGKTVEEYSAFIDKDGTVKILLSDDTHLYYGSKFSEGLCPVRRGDYMFGSCEYIDKSGQTVISGGYWGNTAGDFINGLAVVSSSVAGGTGTSNAFAVCGVIKID